VVALRQSRRLLVISVAVLATLAGQVVPAADSPTPRTGPDPGVAVDAVSKHPLTNDSDRLLALGRQVYADLQQARGAALNRQAGQLRAALESARAKITLLSLPPALVTLKAQMQIIANNLADTSRPVDADLWIPIDAELDKVSLYLAPENQVQAHIAAKAGRLAAVKGDRQMAGVQGELLVSYLQQTMGAFPLRPVSADIQSAWSSASLPQPYWKGALEAVQSALAEVRWVAGANADALLSAYTDTVNAYVLWPQRRQSAINSLGKAQSALSALPGGAGLAADVRAVMEKNNLGDDDIRHLVDAISRRIDSERAAWREKLLDRFAAEPPGRSGATAG
jgi:hypothetical protein